MTDRDTGAEDMRITQDDLGADDDNNNVDEFFILYLFGHLLASFSEKTFYGIKRGKNICFGFY